MVTRSCKLSLGTEVCLSNETTGARSLRAGTVAMDAVMQSVVGAGTVDEAAVAALAALLSQ